jgi:hypothetical protein
MAEYEAARERGDDVTPPPPMPYERATQQRRAQRAEKDLALLGKVNPLALEEFAALEERYRFLSTQLEDLGTRRDPLTVVREADDKILEVFTQASPTSRASSSRFATLFPGEGRLCHRPRGHAHHRHEVRPAHPGRRSSGCRVVRRRALAHRHGVARGHLPPGRRRSTCSTRSRPPTTSTCAG